MSDWIEAITDHVIFLEWAVGVEFVVTLILALAVVSLWRGLGP